MNKEPETIDATGMSLVEAVSLPVRLRPALSEDEVRRIMAKARAARDTFEGWLVNLLRREAAGTNGQITVMGTLTRTANLGED